MCLQTILIWRLPYAPVISRSRGVFICTLRRGSQQAYKPHQRVHQQPVDETDGAQRQP